MKNTLIGKRPGLSDGRNQLAPALVARAGIDQHAIAGSILTRA
ncbi:MAG: hypothetical protein V4754_08280 [Pseudomonadota bacterium]